MVGTFPSLPAPLKGTGEGKACCASQARHQTDSESTLLVSASLMATCQVIRCLCMACPVTPRHTHRVQTGHHCHLATPQEEDGATSVLPSSPQGLLYLPRTKLLKQKWVRQKGLWRNLKIKQENVQKFFFSQRGFRIGSARASANYRLNQAPATDHSRCMFQL